MLRGNGREGYAGYRYRRPLWRRRQGVLLCCVDTLQSLFHCLRFLTPSLRVNTCTDLLPQNKPRYVMGVGYPEDLVVSVALGADMFDCVWPTRTAVYFIPTFSYRKKYKLMISPALRQCHNHHRYAESTSRHFRQRLQPHRRRLHLSLL